jgi:hypothetical protein
MSGRRLEFQCCVSSDIGGLAELFIWFKQQKINLRKVDMVEDPQDRTKCHLFLQVDCSDPDAMLQILQEKVSSPAVSS